MDKPINGSNFFNYQTFYFVKYLENISLKIHKRYKTCLKNVIILVPPFHKKANKKFEIILK